MKETKMVHLTIDGVAVSAPEGTTILGAALNAGIKVPTLCFLQDINEIGACRICVVEVEGQRSLVASCVYPVAEGMVVHTNTERVRRSRIMSLELILSNHRMDCLTCSRNKHCELQALASEFNIEAIRYGNDNMIPQIEDSAYHLVRDNSKCVLCRRCVAVCRKQQEAGVLTPVERGFNTHIACAFDRDLAEVDCVSCGQCDDHLLLPGLDPLLRTALSRYGGASVLLQVAPADVRLPGQDLLRGKGGD